MSNQQYRKYHSVGQRQFGHLIPPHVTCLNGGTRCSSVVRAFAYGAMGHQIDPS